MSDKARTDPIADPEIFDPLYRERHGRLLASLTRLVRDRHRAEDLAAAAFQHAWEKRAQFRGESSLGTWLYAIGLNAARRNGRQERTVDQDPMVLDTGRYAEPDRLSARLNKTNSASASGRRFIAPRRSAAGC